MRTLILLCCLSLGGCYTLRETERVRMTTIPLPDRPELTGDAQQDLQTVGAHAIHLRRLIRAYNELAEQHNAEHGL